MEVDVPFKNKYMSLEEGLDVVWILHFFTCNQVINII